jgi:glycosyltransferase involved in cell wall biosynthesis
MNMPLLSICIATYNRADYIGETLDSLLPQLGDDTELLIVDGASTDNTKDVVMMYADADPRIRYVRLAAKGGVDQDYCKSVELACGEFCWLFTDDDLLKPGAIHAVKEAIKQGYGLVVVNAEIRDRGMGALLESQLIVANSNRSYGPEEIGLLFRDVLPYLSFIGGVVIRRNLWLSREREAYWGTEFVHVGVIFQKPLPEPALIISEPYIVIRFGNAQWTTRSFEIWMFKWPKLVWSFDHVADGAKQSVCNREPWRSIRTLVSQRSTGAYDIRAYRRYISPTLSAKPWKWFAWSLACCPRSVIVALHYLYSRVKGQKSCAFFDSRTCTARPNATHRQAGGNEACV